jgi:hypothetical protein
MRLQGEEEHFVFLENKLVTLKPKNGLRLSPEAFVNQRSHHTLGRAHPVNSEIEEQMKCMENNICEFMER